MSSDLVEISNLSKRKQDPTHNEPDSNTNVNFEPQKSVAIIEQLKDLDGFTSEQEENNIAGHTPELENICKMDTVYFDPQEYDELTESVKTDTNVLDIPVWKFEQVNQWWEKHFGEMFSLNTLHEEEHFSGPDLLEFKTADLRKLGVPEQFLKRIYRIVKAIQFEYHDRKFSGLRDLSADELRERLRGVSPRFNVLHKYDSSNINKRFYDTYDDFHWPDECFHDGIHEVYVATMVRDLGDINVVDGTFKLSLDIELRWQPKREDVSVMMNDHLDGRDYTPKYFPKLRVYNAQEIDIVSDWCHPILYFKGDDLKFFLYSDQQIIITCRENFEVERFPFDCQGLTVRLGREKPWREFDEEKEQYLPRGVTILEDGTVEADENSIPCKMTFPQQPDEQYQYQKPILEFHNTDPKESASGSVYSMIYIHLFVVRQFKHYIYRLCSILCFATLTTFAVFFMDTEENIESEASFLLTVLLAVVAFMFIYQAEIPKVPYITWMDAYVYFTFAFILLIFVVTIVIFIFFQEEDGYDHLWWKMRAGWVCCGIYVFAHFSYMCMGYRYRQVELRKLKMNDAEFLKFLGDRQAKNFYLKAKSDNVQISESALACLTGKRPYRDTTVRNRCSSLGK